MHPTTVVYKMFLLPVVIFCCVRQCFGLGLYRMCSNVVSLKIV